VWLVTLWLSLLFSLLFCHWMFPLHLVFMWSRDLNPRQRSPWLYQGTSLFHICLITIQQSLNKIKPVFIRGNRKSAGCQNRTPTRSPTRITSAVQRKGFPAMARTTRNTINSASILKEFLFQLNVILVHHSQSYQTLFFFGFWFPLLSLSVC